MKTEHQIEKRGVKLINERRKVSRELESINRIGFTSIEEGQKRKTLLLRLIKLDAQIQLIAWIFEVEK